MAAEIKCPLYFLVPLGAYVMALIKRLPHLSSAHLSQPWPERMPALAAGGSFCC